MLDQVQQEAKEESVQEMKASSRSVVEAAAAEMESPQAGVAPEESSALESNVTEESTETNPSEDATSKKSEEGKVPGAEPPKGFADHPAWKRIMQERNVARQEAEELKKAQVSPEIIKRIENVEKFLNSPEGIKVTMRAEGFSDEKIAQTLKEKGFEQPEKETDITGHVIKELNLDPKALTQPLEFDKMTGADYVADIVRVASLVSAKIAEDLVSKRMAKEIEPIKQSNFQRDIEERSNRTEVAIKKIVADEGVLDYKQDVEPAMHAYLDKVEKEGKSVTPEEALAYFKDINHSLVMERLRKKEKKDVREEKKQGLRSLKDTSSQAQEPEGIRPGESDFDYVSRLAATM